MSRSLFADFGLLRRNRDFRSVFVARTISLLGLGMLVFHMRVLGSLRAGTLALIQ